MDVYEHHLPRRVKQRSPRSLQVTKSKRQNTTLPNSAEIRPIQWSDNKRERRLLTRIPDVCWWPPRSDHEAPRENTTADSIEYQTSLSPHRLPGTNKNPSLPPTMAWDKMEDQPVGPERVSLGIKFINPTLEITVEDYKVEWLLEILNAEWGKGRKSFDALMAAVLVGNVVLATQTCPWLRWSLHHIIEALKILIRKNYNRLARTRDYNELLGKEDEQWLDPANKRFARYICPNQSIMKAVWRCKSKNWINYAIREEIKYVWIQCRNHLSGKNPRNVQLITSSNAD